VRRLLPLALAALVLAAALTLLHRELATHDLRSLLAAARAIPAGRIAAAMAATAASYLLLTLYDVQALRHIGRPLGYARTAAVSFASTVTSHNVGLSGIGGTAVRYRLYTTFGLSAPEIAEVVAFCALAFWIGFLLLGGVLFTLEPVRLPGELHALVSTTRPLGIAFLGVSLGVAAWSLGSRRPLVWRSWRIRPPAPRDWLLQLPLAAADWGCAAAVLFALLPGGHGLTFGQVFSVFLVAQAAAMVSHVPAGLGVFEAVVLHLLPGDLGTPEVVGVLLVYRAVYYLIPLACGMLLFFSLEVAQRRAGLEALGRWLTPLGALLVPRVLALTTFLGGTVLLLTGSLPARGERMAWIREVVPLPVVELSHFLGSLVGAGLVLLSRALLRRTDAALWLSVALLAAGIVLALVRRVGYEEAALLGVVLLLLLSCRRSFTRRAALLHPVGGRWWFHLGLVVVGTLWLGLLAYRHVEYSHELWWRFGYPEDAPRFLRASAGMLVVLGLFGAMQLLRAVPPRLSLPSDEDLEHVRAILAKEPTTLGHLALVRDKHLLFDEQRTGFLMFAVQGTSWVAMGDPVGGSEAVQRELVWRFDELAELAGGRPVHYQVSEERLGWYAEAGASLLKLGEEARVELADFTLEGRANKGLRSNLHHMHREGLSFAVLSAAEARAALAELEQISSSWLETKAVREKGFSLGSFRADYVTAGPVAVVRREGRLLAFANLWLGAPGGELSVDLMRHAGDGPGGLMDLMFAELLLWGRAQGYRWFSLGMAPLSGLDERDGAPVWNRVAGLVFRHGEHFYNFQGLREYKAKFHPVWSSRYLATPGGLALPAALLDVTALISGGVAATLAK
jgi:phosphatidylglycerol lysyltransferase